MRDLVLLVPDKNIEATMNGVLGRPQAVPMRRITWNVFVHPEKDPGCLLRGSEFLRPLRRQFRYALVVFDRQGSGREDLSRGRLQSTVHEDLRASGWGDCCAVVCLDPELENWVWSDSPEVAAALGWTGGHPDLRPWLEAQGLWVAERQKPYDPKRAMERVLWEVRKPRSSSIYTRLAERVGFDRCTDRAFLHLRRTLRGWFPPA